MKRNNLDAYKPEELVEYLRQCNPEEMDHSDSDLKDEFSNRVKNDPDAFARLGGQIMELHPKFVLVFFNAIRDAVMEKKSIEWRVFLPLCEQTGILPNSSNLDRVGIRYAIVRTMHEGMERRSIDFALKDTVWAILHGLLMSETNDPYEGTTIQYYYYPDYILVESLGGTIFHSIFSYAIWCNDNTEGGKELVPEVRGLISEYLDNMAWVTIQRHTVLGYYLPYLYWLDKDWIRTKFDKIFGGNENSSKAAWYGCIMGRLNMDIFADLADKYDTHVQELKNKGHDHFDPGVDKYVVGHISMAYLLGFDSSKTLFDKMISNLNYKLLFECVQYISQILREVNRRPYMNMDADAFRGLWKHGKLARYADIHVWFTLSPFDEKERLELLHTMLEKADDNMLMPFPVKELEPYATLHPELTLKCLSQLLQKKNDAGDYYPAEEFEGLFRILLDDDKTSKEATRMIQDLQNHSFVGYHKLSKLIE